MKKLLLTLVAIFALVSSALAQDQTLLYDLQFGSTANTDALKYYPKNQDYTSSFTYKLSDDVKFTVANFNNNNNGWTDVIKCGRKTNKNVEYPSVAYVSTDFIPTNKVTKVEVKITAMTTTYVNSIKFLCSSDKNNWTDIVSANLTKWSAENNVITFDNPNAVDGMYYKVEFDCASGTANGFVSLNEIKFYTTSGGEGTIKQPAGLAYAENSFTATVGKEFTAPTLENPNSLDVTYSSSNEEIAKVDINTGAVTLEGAEGTVTITAASKENDNFYAGSATYTIKVAAPAREDLLYDLMFGSTYNTDEKYYPKNTSLTTSFTYTLNEDEKFTVAMFNNNNNGWSYIRAGKDAGIAYIATDFPVSDIVTDVEVYTEKAVVSNINSITLQTSTDGKKWEDVGSGDLNKLKASTASVLSIANSQMQPNMYYRVAFDLNAGSQIIHLNAVKFYGEEYSGPVKKAAGLEFAEKSYAAYIGEEFTAPTVENPNELAVTYSSDNEEVAKVDASTGAVTLTGNAGTANITASSEATDEYFAGSDSYKLEVMKALYTVKELVENSTAADVTSYFRGELTVVYANGAYIYVVDNYNDPALIYHSGTSYKAGDVLTPGYTLSYTLYNGLPEWKFILGVDGALPAVKETREVTYSEVEEVSDKNVNRVGYIKNVTFADATPTASAQNFTGTTADGETINFRTSWKLNESMPAGTYNVLGAVSIYDSLKVYPISFEEVVSEPEPVFPTTLNVTADCGEEDFDYDFIPAELSDYGTNDLRGYGMTDNDSVVVTIDIPEGYDSMIYSPVFEMGGDVDIMSRRAPKAEWMDMEFMLENGMVEGNKITVPADGEEYEGQIMLVKNGNADVANYITYNLQFDKKVVELPEAPITHNGGDFVKFIQLDADHDDNQFGYPSLHFSGETAGDTFTVSLKVPEGWHHFVYIDLADNNGDIEPMNVKKLAKSLNILAEEDDETSAWPSVADLEGMGYKTGNDIEIPADENDHEFIALLAKNGKVNVSSPAYHILANVKGGVMTSVEVIETTDTDAVYFTLQGVKVANPAAGIYIRVANGKAQKVIRK